MRKGNRGLPKILSRRAMLATTMVSIGTIMWVPSRKANAALMGTLFGKGGKKTSLLTPNDNFYITSSDITPSIDIADWELSIDGLIKDR